jgi:hypothetical protein
MLCKPLSPEGLFFGANYTFPANLIGAVTMFKQRGPCLLATACAFTAQDWILNRTNPVHDISALHQQGSKHAPSLPQQLITYPKYSLLIL